MRLNRARTRKLFVIAPELSTLSERARLLSLSGRAAALSYPAPPWLASRLTSTAQERCLSPTSATDVRYEHPTIRSTPKLAACAAKTTSAMCPELLTPCHPERGVGPPCGNPTPGGAAFDDASPASDVPPTFLFVIEEDTGSARRQSHPAAAFSAAVGPAIRPLTLPVAPRFGLLPGVFGAPGPLPPPSRQRGRLPRSEAPSIDKLLPAAFAERARHRSHSFAAAGRLPTLFRSSLCSRTEELDPRRWSRAIHPWS